MSEQQAAQVLKLTTELSELKFLHETSSKDSQVELKCKLDLLTKDLNARWQERLKAELEALRAELSENMEKDKRHEIAMLNELKDGELKNMKSVWQSKTNELLEEVSQLKRELGEKEQDIRTRFDSLKSSLEAENKTLLEQIDQVFISFRLVGFSVSLHPK